MMTTREKILMTRILFTQGHTLKEAWEMAKFFGTIPVLERIPFSTTRLLEKRLRKALA